MQRAQLIELFVQLGEQGRTVIVSSHVLAEVERMTHRVVAMVDGRLAATGDLASLRAAMTDKPRQVHIRSRPAPRAGRGPGGSRRCRRRDALRSAIAVSTTDPLALAKALPMVAHRDSVTISEIAPADESMESVFRYLVESAR